MYDSITMDPNSSGGWVAMTSRNASSSRTRWVSRLRRPLPGLTTTGNSMASSSSSSAAGPGAAGAAMTTAPAVPAPQRLALGDLVQQPLGHDAVVVVQPNRWPVRTGGQLGVGVGDDAGGIERADRLGGLVVRLAGDVDERPELAQEPEDQGVIEPARVDHPDDGARVAHRFGECEGGRRPLAVHDGEHGGMIGRHGVLRPVARPGARTSRVLPGIAGGPPPRDSGNGGRSTRGRR